MANEIRYDSRYIVVKYLNHKLLKKGYEWKFQSSGEDDDTINTGVEDSPPNSDRRLLAPSAGGGNDSECLIANRVTRSDPHSRIYRALREAGGQIERMYQREFEEMSHQMIFSPNAAQRSFLAVTDELFRDGVNWGRIVNFFEFGGSMCVESFNREMASHVENISHWMTDYLNGSLENWIEENGGWMQKANVRKVSITSDLSEEKRKQLCALLGDVDLTLLYKASVHGYQASAFHQQCDNQGPTLLVAYNRSGYIFGGYTSVDYSQSGQKITDKDAFLFSIHGKIPTCIKVNSESNARYDDSEGPNFGQQLYFCYNNQPAVYSKERNEHPFNAVVKKAFSFNPATLYGNDTQLTECEVYKVHSKNKWCYIVLKSGSLARNHRGTTFSAI